MTDKELKKLSKSELLSLMLTQSKEIDRLKEELAETKRRLEERNILIGRSGSLADASLAVFHVLEDAQKAADLYLENIKSGRFEKEYEPAKEAEPQVETDTQKAAEPKKETSQYAGNAWCGHFRQNTKPQQQERGNR